MAKAGFEISLEAYSRRDPVNGDTKTFLRKAHSRQTSLRLKNFQRCVADQLRGHSFRGGSPVEDARAVRASFAQAAKSCAGRGR